MPVPSSAFGTVPSSYDTYFPLENDPAAYFATANFGLMDGLNECRSARVAEVLSDFRTLQYYITSVSTEPRYAEEYHTDGWTALRQCAEDGRHILECAADTQVQTARGGESEQVKAELKHVLLDAFSRRHEGQKIYMRQAAAQRWVENREMILQGQPPHAGARSHLQACDRRLRSEMTAITDESIYNGLAASDRSLGRWMDEDPSLRSVLRWLRARQR